ncbi:MAG: 2-oxoglutarate dehydrogenase E1 component, partial [Flavobacteriales bacterium]|nr:2-oxoglutarate dehydrogenase E1 component [Flavobacteriales bacterium]
AETLNLSQLQGYHTGGTIHIITNNQIGFTTEPRDSRSTLYASDLAKGFEIPIVHVNADDVAACIAVARMAYAYRELFGKDFIIDLVGYRRWGHNEGDEPAFTQPMMYAQISNHPTVRQIWAEHLIAAGLLSADEAAQMVADVTEKLQQARREAEIKPHEDRRPKPAPAGLARSTRTAVPAETLRTLNAALLNRPSGFTMNSRLERTIERRRTALEQANAIDWGHAEALAFASILADGIPIRITGQDSERGTFSHRHAVLRDTNSGQAYTPLQRLPQANASFAIYNSPLSEAAVLGFEYGYSSHAPNTLVLWEGQFGDFANGAQVIIDQFISSGRAKWGQLPALVLLLPHGYEGQGAEHSSARMERFLQSCAGSNMVVVNCTTPANFFHVMRRQLAWKFRKPLVVFTPKSLLRHPKCVSPLDDLVAGSFKEVIDDVAADPKKVTTVIFTQGKVHYDLAEYREKNASASLGADTALVRIEQLHPLPADQMRAVIRRYAKAERYIWVQEEPQNMGAWQYIAMNFTDVKWEVIARPASGAPATGSSKRSANQQTGIVEKAFGGTTVAVKAAKKASA